MPYDIVLLDADATLFDYQKTEYAALRSTCEAFSIPFGEALLARYHVINDALWKAFERGETTQEQLRVERFQQLFSGQGISVDCAAFNRRYVQGLGEGTYLLDGALELCRLLHTKGLPLYIVTNGTVDTQKRRLAHSEIAPYITAMFISQEVGFQKPRREFFERVFAQIGNPDPDRIILLGDSLTSDMRGGRNAGIATCWFAPEEAEDTVGCDYRISRLMDFPAIVFG